MSDFLRVARVDEIPPGGKRLVEVDDRFIVICRVGSEFFALDDVCTHDGGPLSEGTLVDCSIACPRHGARFDLRTGAALTMPATQPTVAHEVKVEGETVFLRVNDA